MIDLRLGDSLLVLKALPDSSIDAICTDPPSATSFMNKSWDTDKGGRDPWIAWMTSVMTECLRVAKPGAYALIWAFPRTSHWTAMAVEDAGWVINTKIYHLFGSGFPKSMNISKAIDKAAGAEREVVGRQKATGNARGRGAAGHYANGIPSMTGEGYEVVKDGWDVTAPATDLARQWEGWGTQLKPAAEEWILAQKPISEKTISLNVAKWGTGALNIAASRIEGTWERNSTTRSDIRGGRFVQGGSGALECEPQASHPAGRWPSNTVFSHATGCQQVGVRRVKSGNGTAGGNVEHAAFGGGMKNRGNEFGYADADGLETVDEYICEPQCPVRLLDEQSGERKSGGRTGSINGMGYHGGNGAECQSPIDPSVGGASRFFQTFAPEPDLVPFLYVPKASKADRGDGNTHPCVKSTALMKYLCTLICPPNGTVLDCFLGSGSTGVAAVELGFDFIGIEMEPEYMKIAQARINAAAAKPVQHTLLETSS